MLKLTLRIRFAGSVCKPPYGAVVKSYGVERIRKRVSGNIQVRIKEMNASEPLMKLREC